MSYIYKIELIETKECYIGSTKNNPNYRFTQHINKLKKGIHHSSFFQEIWNKNSPELFSFQIIEECPYEKQIEREQFYIDTENSIFNNTRSAFNSSCDPKVALKISKKLKSFIKSEEHKRKIGLSNKGKSRNKGKKHPHLINYNKCIKKGTIWITNGIKSKQVRSDFVIPEGYYKGRITPWQ